MNSSALLGVLKEAALTGGKSAKRYILRFRTKTSFLQFLRKLESSSDWAKIKSLVQPMHLIDAVSCPLQSADFAFRIPGVGMVEEDSPVQVHSPHAPTLKPAASQPNNSPHVPWGVRQIRAPEAWRETKGQQIRIGVIDTGIDYFHPDLRGRISRGINLLNRDMLPIDDNGHGTHISGTIAASAEHSGLMGVAPLATIHPVKAFDHNGTAYISDIVLGLDWCVRNRVHIINMSFGMKNRSRSLHDAVRNAYRLGIPIIASSGNEAKMTSIDYPARFPQVISVGATTLNKKIAPFSNRGKAIDIYAPGDKVRSTWPNRKYMKLSGTSMATSHVTGVIALMLTLRPDLKPDEIKVLLQRTSNPIAGVGSRGAVRSGEIDALRAIRSLKSSGKL